MKIDPIWQLSAGVAVAVITAIAQGAVAIPPEIPNTVRAALVDWDKFLLGVWLVVQPILAGYSSEKPGPFVGKSASPTAAAVALAAVLFLGSGDARAATTNPLNKIGAWAQGDVDAAIAAAQKYGDGVGAACWGQMKTLANALAEHPLPVTLKLASDIEYARVTQAQLNALCRQPACAQVWQDAANAAAALQIAPLPISFASVCARVPVVGLAQ